MNLETPSFKLKPEEIRNLVSGMGYCYASHRITMDGMEVGYMYRETSEAPTDSGWRFFSGTETQEEVDNPDNIGIYDVNTIANYDASILPFLNAEPGTSLERIGDAFRVT